MWSLVSKKALKRSLALSLPKDVETVVLVNCPKVNKQYWNLVHKILAEVLNKQVIGMIYNERIVSSGLEGIKNTLSTYYSISKENTFYGVAIRGSINKVTVFKVVKGVAYRVY